ncbi:MAG: NAD-dependent epimerase/dehydratase family protein [Chloroflexi bacterium OHK40]
MTRVLINGIDGPLGARVATMLSAEPGVTVIGLGRETPPAPVGRAEWLEAVLNGQQLLALLRAEEIEVVVHLAFVGAERPTPSREAAVQQNVLGSMELLGACAAAGVRRVVLRSHTGVYGANPLNPAFIDEARPVAVGALRGLLRDYAEVEQFVAEFAARHPGLAIVSLRLAPLLGGWSPIVRYLTETGPRMLAGFDPCLQLLHFDDAAAGFVRAALADVRGAFNLAADDTVALSQAIRLAGQQPVLVLEPLVRVAQAIGNDAILGHWPYDLSFLRHSCVADTARAKAELGWTPAHSAVAALQALRAGGHAGTDPKTSEARLRAFLARRS